MFGIRRREFITLVSGAAVAIWAAKARAQQLEKKRTIAIFNAGTLDTAPYSIFFNTLRELGWIEGKNTIFERRFAENRLERLPTMAGELVGLNVDVIAAF